MSVIARIKTVTGIIVVAAVGAVAMHLNPSAFKVNTGGDDDNYVLSVTWSPINSTHKTTIEVTVDGGTLMVREPRLSPWGHTAVIAKGAQVKLTAALYMTNLQRLDCMIMRNGRSVPRTGFHVIHTPGVVTCTA